MPQLNNKAIMFMQHGIVLSATCAVGQCCLACLHKVMGVLVGCALLQIWTGPGRRLGCFAAVSDDSSIAKDASTTAAEALDSVTWGQASPFVKHAIHSIGHVDICHAS